MKQELKESIGELLAVLGGFATIFSGLFLVWGLLAWIFSDNDSMLDFGQLFGMFFVAAGAVLGGIAVALLAVARRIRQGLVKEPRGGTEAGMSGNVVQANTPSSSSD